MAVERAMVGIGWEGGQSKGGVEREVQMMRWVEGWAVHLEGKNASKLKVGTVVEEEGGTVEPGMQVKVGGGLARDPTSTGLDGTS